MAPRQRTERFVERQSERRVGLAATLLSAAVSILSIIGFGAGGLWMISQFKEEQAVFKATTTLQVKQVQDAIETMKRDLDARLRVTDEHIREQDSELKKLLIDNARKASR